MSQNVYTQLSVQQSNANSCPVTAMGEAFNPFVDPYISDPYAFYEKARAEEPVFYSPEIDHWVISNYKDVKGILHDNETYSSRMAQSPIKPWPVEAVEMVNQQNFNLMPNLTNNDPPSHTHVRRFLQDAFTPRRITWIEPHIRTLVNESIDRFIHLGRADLVKELLYETPARVLYVFLGIPTDDIDKVKVWSEGRAVLTWGKLSDEEIMAQIPTFIEYVQYCYDLVDHLEQNPGDDYTSELLQRLKTEQPEGFSKDRIVVTIFGLLMAGHETTTNQSGNGIRTLLQHRESWEALCADPSLIPNACEEIIRYESSVISWRRVTKREVEIAGVTIPKDAQLLLMLASANRDEDHFTDGETFDIHRKNAKQHMSFGHGIHYCLGAPLARLELKIFLEELTRRIPSLRLVNNQSYTYSPNTSHRGPTSLWVEWDVASS
ncbi:MAG: cytochrome P450 [Chloroflexota bacterium]